MIALPQVISEDVALVKAQVKADYEAATGKTLYPAQVESQMCNVIAYRESLLRASINDAARQCLPRFARLPMLVEIGALVGVERIPAQFARTTLEFSIPEARTTLTIVAKGTRIQASTGAVFATTTDALIPIGQTTAQVLALADTEGSAYNGLLQNTIKEPFDTLPTGVECTNITTSSGGAEIEEVERLRMRVLMAINRPSSGSGNSYRFTAFSADSRVIGVSVKVIAAGWVRLAVLADGDPAEVVAAVDRAVNSDDSKPLTDKADVVAATGVPVSIGVTITPRLGTLPSSLMIAVQSELLFIQTMLRYTLGYDSVGSEISARLQNLGGIKRVTLTGADVPIDWEQYAILSWSTPDITEAESD